MYILKKSSNTNALNCFTTQTLWRMQEKIVGGNVINNKGDANGVVTGCVAEKTTMTRATAVTEPTEAMAITLVFRTTLKMVHV